VLSSCHFVGRITSSQHILMAPLSLSTDTLSIITVLVTLASSSPMSFLTHAHEAGVPLQVVYEVSAEPEVVK
jgi:hypothetical protein